MKSVYILAIIISIFGLHIHAANKTEKKSEPQILKFGSFKIQAKNKRYEILNSPKAVIHAFPYIVIDKVTNKMGMIQLKERSSEKDLCSSEMKVLQEQFKKKVITSKPVLDSKQHSNYIECNYTYTTSAGNIYQQIFHKKNDKKSLLITYTDKSKSAKELKAFAGNIRVQ